jgi:hypothetical protein
VCGGNNLFLVPLFLSEVSPTSIRGKIALFFGISICIGEGISIGLGIPLGFGVDPYFWMLIFILPLPLWIFQLIAFWKIYKHDTAEWLIS